MRKKIISSFMVLTLTTTSVLAFADRQQELNKTNIKRNEIQSKIQENKQQSNSVAQEIEQISSQIDKTNDELSVVEKELNELNKSITENKEKLIEAEKNLSSRNDTFEERLRVMYKRGTVGYIEVLLASTDITDFLDRAEMIKTLIDHDVNLLSTMKSERDEIEKTKKELEVQQINVASVKRKVEIKKNDLIVATRAKESLLGELETDRARMEIEHDALTIQANEISAIIAQKQREAASQGQQSSGGSSANAFVNSGTISSKGMTWPAPGYNSISSPFGNRIHPIFGTRKMHTGIDIPTPSGASIVAAADGVVQHSGGLGGYGNTIIIDHGDGIATLYAHNSSLSVGVGQSVKRGQVVSKAGSTGYSNGPHLHFEVRQNGNFIDPAPWVR